MSILGLVIMLYGDSLTQQTRAGTRAALLEAGAAEVRFIGDYPAFVSAEGLPDDNGGDSARALRFFEYLRDTPSTAPDAVEGETLLDEVDLVVVNCGLHDMFYWPPDQTRLRRQTEEEYERNLRAIGGILGAKLIWRETFPTHGVSSGVARDQDDVDRYNLIARYALPGVWRVAQFPIPAEKYAADGVHLADGQAVGQEVARQIVSGEVQRSVSVGVGTTITLDVPAQITIGAEGLGARVEAKD